MFICVSTLLLFNEENYLLRSEFYVTEQREKLVIFFTEEKTMKETPLFHSLLLQVKFEHFSRLSKKYLLQDSNLGLWLYATMLQLLSNPDDIHITIHANVTFPIFFPFQENHHLVIFFKESETLIFSD